MNACQIVEILKKRVPGYDDAIYLDAANRAYHEIWRTLVANDSSLFRCSDIFTVVEAATDFDLLYNSSSSMDDVVSPRLEKVVRVRVLPELTPATIEVEHICSPGATGDGCDDADVAGPPGDGGPPPVGGGTGTIYDIIFSLDGKPNDTDTMAVHSFRRDVNFAGNFANSGGQVLVNPTTARDWVVKKNGSSIGTIHFATDGTVTFTTTAGAAQSFVTGDYITFISSVQDDTLEDITITLAGTRA